MVPQLTVVRTVGRADHRNSVLKLGVYMLANCFRERGYSILLLPPYCLGSARGIQQLTGLWIRNAFEMYTCYAYIRL